MFILHKIIHGGWNQGWRNWRNE